MKPGFIAADGTAFDTEVDALNHENLVRFKKWYKNNKLLTVSTADLLDWLVANSASLKVEFRGASIFKPLKRNAKCPSQARYPFDDLEVGESLEIPGVEVGGDNFVANLAYRAAKRLGVKFSVKNNTVTRVK